MRHTWRRWTGLAASGMVLALLAPTAPAQADPARQWHLTPPGVRPAAAAGVAADAAQTTLHLSRGGKHMDLVVRVAADGVAYRYVLPGNGWHTVTGEASEYAIAGSADSFLLPFDNGRSDYESIHNHSTVDGAAP